MKSISRKKTNDTDCPLVTDRNRERKTEIEKETGIKAAIRIPIGGIARAELRDG